MSGGLQEFYDCLSEKERPLYLEVAEFAAGLGYKPQRAKTQSINYVFTNNRTKKHLLKFSIEKGFPQLKMKFYAAQAYSSLFHEAIRAVVEEYDYKYTGCYGCGKCKDGLEGYDYTYPDGRHYFRCGGELIALPSFTRNDLPEILSLLERQHSYFSDK